MKRVLPSVISAFVIVLIITFAVNFNTVKKYAEDVFLNAVCTILEKEEAEKQERIKNGEIVPGRDTALIWGNLFVIYHDFDGYSLYIENKDGINPILKKITCRSNHKGKLYVLSKEGYAVIDKNNLCRVFVTVSDKIESDNIQYLSSFEEFAEIEQKYFKKLKDNAK